MFADVDVAKNAKDYLHATSEQPAFDRIVGYVLEGFRFAPTLMIPKLKSPLLLI